MSKALGKIALGFGMSSIDWMKSNAKLIYPKYFLIVLDVK